MDGNIRISMRMLLEIVGGRKQLLDQANILENETNAGKMGKFKPNWKDVKTSIQKIDYDVAIIPELCEREQIEDPRESSFVSLPVWKNGGEKDRIVHGCAPTMMIYWIC